jgi:DnaJ-class molecular chaperone
MSVTCNLCCGDGLNHSGVVMRINNEWCPRCGGYGTVPASSDTYDANNPSAITDEDRGYMRNNGAQL